MPWLDLESEITEEFALFSESLDQEREYVLFGISANKKLRRNEKIRTKYAWCKANGLCVDCNLPSVSKTYPKCETHLRKTVEYLKKSRRKVFESGLCLRCRNFRGDERLANTYCKSCNDHFVALRRASRSSVFVKVEGDCVNCGSNVTRECRSVPTCSKRCAQIHQRKCLIKSKICIKCKVKKARDDAQLCVECSDATKTSSAHGARHQRQNRVKPATKLRIAATSPNKMIIDKPCKIISSNGDELMVQFRNGSRIFIDRKHVCAT